MSLCEQGARGNQKSEVAQHDFADLKGRARDPHLVDCFHSGRERPRRSERASAQGVAGTSSAQGWVWCGACGRLERLHWLQRCLHPPKRPPRWCRQCGRSASSPTRRLSPRSRPKRLRGRELSIDGPTMSWEIVGDRGRSCMGRPCRGRLCMGRPCRGRSSGQLDLSKPVCLVQRRPLFDRVVSV